MDGVGAWRPETVAFEEALFGRDARSILRNDANNWPGRPEAALLSLIQHSVFSQIPLPYYHLPSLFLYRLSLLALSVIDS